MSRTVTFALTTWLVVVSLMTDAPSVDRDPNNMVERAFLGSQGPPTTPGRAQP